MIKLKAWINTSRNTHSIHSSICLSWPKCLKTWLVAYINIILGHHMHIWNVHTVFETFNNILGSVLNALSSLRRPDICCLGRLLARFWDTFNVLITSMLVFRNLLNYTPLTAYICRHVAYYMMFNYPKHLVHICKHYLIRLNSKTTFQLTAGILLSTWNSILFCSLCW